MSKRRVPIASRRGSPVGPPGVVMVITLLLVGLLLLMATTLVNLASSDYQVANNESLSIQALYNADAGTEEARMRISPTAPAAVAIPVVPLANWRAYIYSGSIATPTQAEMQAAAQSLDPCFGKVIPGGSGSASTCTTAESTANYVYYSTIQVGGGAIPWGWARIQHKTNNAGNILYQNTLSGQGTNVESQVTNPTGLDSGGNPVANEPILIVTAEGNSELRRGGGSVRRMIAMEFLPIVPTTTNTTPHDTTTTTTVVTDPFSMAAHGKGSVTPGTPVISLVGNMYTDSYDSRNGDYNVNGNRHSKGDVSTDAISNNAISVNSGATVNGGAKVGPDGNTSTAITGSSNITGAIGTEDHVWDMPLSTIPVGVANSGALSIAGNTTRTLGAGTYWFSSISVTGNARIVTTGAVKIYVTGSVDIGGNGVATAGNLPPNLLIYGTVDPNNAANTCTSVSIHGNGDFYGAVYAPSAAIQTSGNGSVFGALSGNTVLFNGSGHGNFHYDEALGNLGETTQTTTRTTTTYTTSTTYSFTGYNRYSWREIAY